MNLLYVLDKPNLYGSERHVQKLIESFSNVHRVHLLTFQNGPLLDLLTIDKFLFDFTWFDMLNYKRIKKIANFIRLNKIDLIHAHQPKAIFVMSILGFFLGIKTIITIHSLPNTNAQSYTNRLKSAIVYIGHFSIKVISEFFASKIIYLSHFSYKTALIPKKAIIISNWVDVDSIGLTKKNTSDQKKIKFLTVGTVSYNKGFDRLMKVLEMFEDKNWELHVVGDIDAAFQDQLDSALSSFLLKDQIIFHGFQENVDSYFEEADVFILLSRGETFGLVYIEAMKMGLPVIAWDIPVVHEILPKGNLILKSAGEINKIKGKDFIKNVDLAIKNIQFVRNNFSKNTIIQKYMEVYCV